MRDAVDPNQLVFIYLTTQADLERAEEHPPQLPFDVTDPERAAQLRENAISSAGMYDPYRDVVQCSFLSGVTTTHFLLCDDHRIATDPEGQRDGARTIHVFDAEDRVINAITGYITSASQELAGGMVLDKKCYAGWKIQIDMWPMLVNKAFTYGCHLPQVYMTDLRSRWSTNNELLDVSGIYSQGMSMSMRKLPALQDVLRSWGYGSNYAMPEDIRAAICDSPITVAASIEPYLFDMQSAVLRYYELCDTSRPVPTTEGG